MPSRTLSVQFVGDTAALSRAFGRARTDAKGLGGDLSTSAKRSSSALKSLHGAVALTAGALGAVGLAGAAKLAFSEFQESRKVAAQTNAVLKSTGSAAKVSAKQVQDLANAISRKAGIDDEAIQAGENVLLTFTRIRDETGKGNDVFKQATQATTDLSVALGKDMRSSAILVGKALNDPVRGATALRRAGVQLTDQQQQQIKSFVASGNVLGAQKIILGELTTEFGGSAAAQATASDKMNVALRNLAEAAGRILVPALDVASRMLTGLINQMLDGRGVGGALVTVFRDIAAAIGGTVAAVSGIVGWFRQHETVTLALGAALGVVLAAFAGFRILAAVQAAITGLRVAVLALNTAFLTNPVVLVVAALAALAAGLVIAYRESSAFRGIVNALWNGLRAGAKVIADVAGAVINGLGSALSWAKGHWPLLLGILTGPFGLAIVQIAKHWDRIKSVFTGGVAALKSILTTGWKILKAPVDLLAGGIRDAFSGAWDKIKGVFDTGIHAIAGFVNLLIKAINILPGVNIKPITLGGGGSGNKPANAQDLQKAGFAHGGAFARTGGIVNRPITLMGEEAPTHPEWVIPSNPRYRDRARGLLAQAAGAIGMQAGGQWSVGALEGLWQKAGGAARLARTMAIISTAESGVAGQYGNQYAHNPSGATGLWQILGALVPGNLMDALTNARNAVAKYKAQGLGAWKASEGMWGPLLGKNINTGSTLDIGGILGSLPKPTSAMGVFKGLGAYLRDKVAGWVKQQATSLVGGRSPGGIGLGGYITGGPAGTTSFLGVLMAKWVAESLRYAQGKGVAVRPTSGYRPGRDPHTATGASEHQGLQYPHGAVDFGGYHDAAAKAMKDAVVAATRGFRYPLVAPIGFVDDGHASGTGHRKGGVYGRWLGSFAQGGITGAEGLAHLHAGELVVPAKKGTVISHGKATVHRGGAGSLASQMARLAVPAPGPAKGIPIGQASAPSPVAATVDDSALVAAMEAQTAAIEEQTAAINARIAIEQQMATNQLRILALKDQGGQILAAVIAAVNGGIGGRVGLGFQSPSYPGGMSRY